MIVKDWVAEAAKELEERIRSDSLYDNDVEVIIASHCPFKPGVAYMPVPRCETCAHWQPEFEYCVSIHLDTQADFGCVRHKEKS